MKIDIVSKDQMYFHLCRLLNEDGYMARLCEASEVEAPDFLILPIKRELCEKELANLEKRIPTTTKVLYGGDEITQKYFTNRLNEYSKNEYFLIENARLTAEAFLSVWQEKTKTSLCSKKVLISGYGRIGRYLAKFLSSLGAEIYIYARREETVEKIKRDGFSFANLSYSPKTDAVINTAPAVLFSRELIAKIPNKVFIFELASSSGFEDIERVIRAPALPGRLLPKSAAEAIYKAVISYLN